MNQICPVCNHSVQPDFFYCPNCGKKLNDPPLSTSVGKQILMYTVSFLLPPFGLGWGFKYLKQRDEKSKFIGWIIIALTAISIIITLLIAKNFIDSYANMLNGISTGNFDNKSLDQLKNLQ